ncbi:hypothetical protein [Paenibacillus amylolyticus]|uniref:hypothetical protein n=1 Tax=Paenibacillus amylolyticus TaxID=1451 RepID=UPI000FD91E8B|nr:hypothetical protein [Paenibacillus amylolyticus]
MSKTEIKAPMDSCTHCGSEKGYYTNDYVVGRTRHNHHFDGTEAENGEYYEHLKHKTGKVAYCKSCNKKLFNMEEVYGS